MSTVLDDTADQTSAAAERLRNTMAAVRLSFTWFGTRKTLTPEQKAQAADSFGAEGKFLSAGKKLIDTSHPAFEAVTQVRSQAVCTWKSMSLPYPEPGVRLIRQDKIAGFGQRMAELKEALTTAVEQLDERYAGLQAAARRRLGDLYNPADYPGSLRPLFDMEWDFPSVEPPDYLRHLNPELYEQEARRVAARFDEAVRLAEAAFLEEFSGLVSHLCERLSGSRDGKPKIFRDSAVENLGEFFQRFRELNVGSSEELERLIAQAQQVVRGVEPQQLRDNQRMRRRIATDLSGVQSVLERLCRLQARGGTARSADRSRPAR